jgi:hypothetical protein
VVAVCRRYGFLHKDAVSMREYLGQETDSFGPCLNTPLLSRSFTDSFSHSEFLPLINPRAHPVAGKQQMLNMTAAAKCGMLRSAQCRRLPCADMWRACV